MKTLSHLAVLLVGSVALTACVVDPGQGGRGGPPHGFGGEPPAAHAAVKLPAWVPVPPAGLPNPFRCVKGQHYRPVDVADPSATGWCGKQAGPVSCVEGCGSEAPEQKVVVQKEHVYVRREPVHRNPCDPCHNPYLRER